MLLNRRDILRLVAYAAGLAATPGPMRRYFLIGQPEQRVLSRPYYVINDPAAIAAWSKMLESKVMLRVTDEDMLFARVKLSMWAEEVSRKAESKFGLATGSVHLAL